MCGETRIPRDMCAGNTIPGETRIPMTPVRAYISAYIIEMIDYLKSQYISIDFYRVFISVRLFNLPTISTEG